MKIIKPYKDTQSAKQALKSTLISSHSIVTLVNRPAMTAAMTADGDIQRSIQR